MKSTILLLLLAVLLAGTPSCKKSNDGLPPMRVTVPQNSTYQRNLGLTGIEDGMAITKQARHARVSTLTRDPITGQMIYTYKPEAGFLGTDQVEITYYLSDGAQVVNTSTTTILLKVII